jgi:hypothetical protein
MLKRAVIIIGILALLAAAVNFPVAMWCAKSRSQTTFESMVSVQGPGAAAHRWPVRGPHQQEWPEITQYTEMRDFGCRHVQVHAGGTHQMQVEYLGWPLPCVRRVQMWWPWNDPAWASKEEPDPKPQVYWLGALGNPLIFGLVPWAVLVLPAEVVLLIQRRRRFRRRLCLNCGYPAGGAEPICTECGARLPREYTVVTPTT